MSRDRLRAQLVADEGLRLRPYVDTVGKVTVGVGRNLTDKGISHAEAMTLLENDIDEAEQALVARWPWVAELGPVRYAVLLNMCFNLGPEGLAGFRNMLALVEFGDYAQAAEHMLVSKWAAQVKGRAVRLAKQMLTGEWQS